MLEWIMEGGWVKWVLGAGACLVLLLAAAGLAARLAVGTSAAPGGKPKEGK